MGSNDFVKPLSTIPGSAINKSLQSQEKNSRECQESNPGPLGAKQESFPFVHCGSPSLQIASSSKLVICVKRLGFESRL